MTTVVALQQSIRDGYARTGTHWSNYEVDVYDPVESAKLVALIFAHPAQHAGRPGRVELVGMLADQLVAAGREIERLNSAHPFCSRCGHRTYRVVGRWCTACRCVMPPWWRVVARRRWAQPWSRS